MYNFQRLQAIFLLLITNSVFAEIDRVDPPNWWAGMHSQDLQLMFYGEEIGDLNVKSESVSVTVSKFFAGDSENYLFVDLILDKGLSAGEVSLSSIDDHRQYDLKQDHELFRSRVFAPQTTIFYKAD